MTDIDTLIKNMPSNVYDKLRCAVETGKWDNGEKLTRSQLEHTQQLVILYQAKHLNQQDHLTVSTKGEIISLSKTELKKMFNEELIADFQHKDL